MEEKQLIGLILLAMGVVDLLLAPVIALRVDPIKRLVLLAGMGSSSLVMAGLGIALWLGYL